MAPHSSTLAWKIPGVEEPGGLPVYGVTQSRTGDLPDPGIEPGSLALQADSLQCEPSSKRKPLLCTRIWLI